MRVHHKTFLLTFILKHSSDNPVDIKAYSDDNTVLPVTRSRSRDLETLEMHVQMPDTVSIHLQMPTGHRLEMTGMSLVGIRVNRDKILNFVEFFAGVDPAGPKNSSVKTLVWDCDGTLSLNLFDPDPFSFLLHIGNKIAV